MIALIYKGNERSKLTNWRPITLLNVAYKLFAKTLQLRLQPVLIEVIDFNQSTFLPMRLILDNILLTHETMSWAEHTKQPLIFLKLDFSKAFDMVDSTFLLRAVATLGIPLGFINMTKMLFLVAGATIKVNGSQSPSFAIERGVRQGYPLAPYLFLIVAEALNAMVKAGMSAGVIKGISLLSGTRQQVIAQYADDTFFTLFGAKGSVRATIDLLGCFCRGSGLVLNWNKSCGYWSLRGGGGRTPWTNLLNVIWVDGDEVSKLLGTPFGMRLSTLSVDKFLQDRSSKMLQYWCTATINSTRRGVIVNIVLLASVMYFALIWGGTKAGIKKVTSSARNYMCSGSIV